MAVSAIPEGFGSVTPYLLIRNAWAAIAFYREAFGAEELQHMPTPDGKIGHAAIKIENTQVMLAEECPDIGFFGPQALGGSSVSLIIYTDDVDTMFARALAAGAEELRPVENHFYGDRAGTLRDPFGHIWTLATHIEDVSNEELEHRSEAFFKEQQIAQL
ncbi:VOC family protein [Agarilytica rhodophyticola]|uniref:VOC family protein n=1 Tax=Agarilytica rhodophyticola TaxID=1737490 RepID=UPI000B348FC3|nr:VOC family protein [Agarilytica rhodophyticola]